MKGFLAVLLVICARPASAQRAPDPLRIWAAGGILAGGAKHLDAGFGLIGQIAVQKNPHQVAIRALGMVDTGGPADSGGFPDTSGGGVAGEIGLIYGRTRTTSRGHAAVASGLSLVAFDTCPDNYPSSCASVGLPIVAEAAANAKVFGLGVQAFANINPKAPYAGLAFFLQIGWMP